MHTINNLLQKLTFVKHIQYSVVKQKYNYIIRIPGLNISEQHLGYFAIFVYCCLHLCRRVMFCPTEFCCTLLSVVFSFEIISPRKRELDALL